MSDDKLNLLQGTLDLMVLQTQRGWIDAAWDTSENNRKAKFYVPNAAAALGRDAMRPLSPRLLQEGGGR